MQNRRLFAVDIGNTQTKCGFFREGKLIKRFRRNNRPVSKILPWKMLSDKSIERIVISIVKPEMTKKVLEYLKRKPVKPLVINPKLKLNINLKYRLPERLGTDRIAAAVAGREIYGCPVIIANFGTALVVDAVSGKGEFLGGAIAPGPGLCADVLSRRTSLLPRIVNFKAKKAVGKSPAECIRSGIFWGAIGQAEKLIEMMKKQTGRRTRVVATGGYAKFLARKVRSIDAIDPDLVLKGLGIIAELNADKK